MIRWLLIVCAVVVSFGCGGGVSVSDCTPGEQAPCSCLRGGEGFQDCAEDGRSFSRCDCGGGTGGVGTGGAGAGGSGTGGSGATASGPQLSSSSLDVLLVIDNSASMADKHEILSLAVPDFVTRLLQPAGAFTPLTDIHIGIVTSSLGGHGADSCGPAGAVFNSTQNDAGRLVARADVGGTPVPTYQDLGFLAWDPDQALAPPGEADRTRLVSDFAQMVRGTGENGCGFEAPLEAMYRFLIQPDPYERIDRVPCFDGDTSNGCAARAGTDSVILQQRADFLRPDSALLVVLLGDENDCSVIDDGQFFIALQQTQASGQLFHMPRATDVCATNPDDPCCHSCGQASPSGCGPASAWPSCNVTGGFYDDAGRDDQINLRCFDQKRRFGIDFLYPVDRYVTGLLHTNVPDRAGALVPNPIYSDLSATGTAVRNSSIVFLAGMLGLPWQLIDDESQSGPPGAPLVFKTAEALASEGLWDAIVGACRGTEQDGRCDVLRSRPTEPLMIESVAERVGIPVGPTGAAIAPSSAPSAQSNPANGHEWNVPARDDLQYACIFPLAVPRPQGADCISDPTAKLKPLCQDPNTGAYGDTQFFAKAFPTTRQLEVLKGFGGNSVVTSICARNVTDQTAPDFGYRPAVNAIVDTLTRGLE